MLFWLKPERQIRPLILSAKKRRRKRAVVQFYVVIFLFMLCFMISIFMVPTILNDFLLVDIRKHLPMFAFQLIQPESNSSTNKGMAAYYVNASKG